MTSSRGTSAGPAPRDPASRRAPRRPSERALLGVTGLVLSLLLAACSGNPSPRDYPFPPPETPAVGTVVEGVASWYGPGYDGKKTSSGETFDQDALTAAHAY